MDLFHLDNKIRNLRSWNSLKLYRNNKAIIIIIIINILFASAVKDYQSLPINGLRQWSTLRASGCENPAACGKARYSRAKGASEKLKRGRAGEASERISRAAIAGHVIGRKRNYGVHGATAASCGSRVITYYRRGAIVPATCYLARAHAAK